MAKSVEILGAEEMKKFLNPEKIKRGTRNAVNATATETRKESWKKAGSTFNLATKRIKKDSKSKDTTWIKRARRGEAEATVGYRGKRPSLHHFSNNKNLQSRTGRRGRPKVKIVRGRPLRLVPRAFTADRIGKNKNVTGLIQRVGAERYPIKRRTGPSIKQMYLNSEMLPHMKRYTRTRMAINWKEKVAAQYRR